jgi:hypothetical protein
MRERFSRACVVDTVYTLMLYLFYSNEDELAHTFYFFGNGIVKSIRDKFQNHYYFNSAKRINKHWAGRFLSLKIIGFFRWPFLRKCRIFGHDHLPYSPYIIGRRDYTYIEDGPRVLSVYFHEKLYHDQCTFWLKTQGLKKRGIHFFIGPLFRRPVANNAQCKALVLTVDDDVPWIAGKTKQFVSLDEVWHGMPEQKKRSITDIYDISEADVAILSKKTHIILTQPFSIDGFISEQEQIKIYGDIIEQYELTCLVVKPHPRDRVDYTKYFPGIYVFDKIVPMQLLTLLGIRFKKAITIFSSSFGSFPYTLEKEWVGSAVHPALYERYPNAVHNPF